MIDTLDQILVADDGAVALSFSSEPIEVKPVDAGDGTPNITADPSKAGQTPSEPPVDSDELDTEFAVLAKSFKERGIIDDTIKIEKGFDYESLERAFEESFKKKHSDLIRQEVYEELRADGITTDVIQGAKLERSGVTREEINDLNTFYALASVDLSKFTDDKVEAELFAWTKLRYEYRGYNPEDAEAAATRDIDRDEDGTVNENKKFFAALYNSSNEAIKQKEALAEEKKKKDSEEERTKVVSLIDSGKILGEEFSKTDVEKIKKAFFEPTEIVKVDGKHYKMTLLQKKLMEEKRSLESQVLKNIHLVLGITPKLAREDGEAKGEDKLANKFLEASRNSGYTAKTINTSKGEGVLLPFEF